MDSHTYWHADKFSHVWNRTVQCHKNQTLLFSLDPVMDLGVPRLHLLQTTFFSILCYFFLKLPKYRFDAPVLLRFCATFRKERGNSIPSSNSEGSAGSRISKPKVGGSIAKPKVGRGRHLLFGQIFPYLANEEN